MWLLVLFSHTHFTVSGNVQMHKLTHTGEKR